MKIRCKNCFKVLGPHEEYCTYCGEHSAQIQHCMETGDYGPEPVDKLKIGIILYLILAFLGNGIIMTIFAVKSGNATSTLYNKANALLYSSILTFVVTAIVCRKSYKDYIWNGNSKQLLGSFVIGTIFIVIAVLFSLVSDATRVLPSYMTDYLSGGTARFFTGENASIFSIMISLICVILVEELIFRRLLIDALDDATMLSDTAIIIWSAIIGTLLDFAWLMSTETIIVTFLLNLVMSGIYAYSNRSLGVNIVIRILLVICEVLIFLV